MASNDFRFYPQSAKKGMILWLFLVLGMINAFAQDNVQAKKDSLWQVIHSTKGEEKLDAYQKLTTYIFYNDSIPENIIKAFSEFEKEALKQGNKERAGGNRGNIMTVRNINQMYDELFKNADADLKFIAAQETWNFYFKAYYTLVEAYFRAGQKEKSLEEAMKFYEQSKKINTPEAKAWALYTIGYAYLYSARYADGEQYLKKALQEIENIEEHHDLKQLIYYDLHQSYNNQGKTKEWALLLDKWENELKNLDVKGKSQTGDWLNLYKAYTLYYLHTEDYDKMEHYCVLLEKWTASVPNIINNIFYVRQEAAMRQGNYAEVLNLAEKRFDNCVKTSNLFGQFSAMQDETYALIHLQKTEESITAFDRTMELRDSIRNVEIQSQLDELRTVYEVDKITAEKEKTHNLLIFALIGCLLLAIALGIWMYLHRQIAKKNRSLYIQIQELLQKEKEAEKLLLEVPEAELSRAMQLFRKLSELMQTEKPFTDPDLNRKKLADRLGTNEIYLADAIREATGETFTTYLSNLRLQYSLELMTEQPDLTFDAVAIDSGHGSYSAFLRLFTKKYGITPSEYRKLAAAKKR
jgi:AraC-like DNA-binding protein